jgi:hypothetical protein
VHQKSVEARRDDGGTAGVDYWRDVYLPKSPSFAELGLIRDEC